MAIEQSIDKLRRAVRDAVRARTDLPKTNAGRLTLYRIAIDTGIDQGTLANFLRGRCNVRLANFAALCDYLGLVLRAGEKPRHDDGTFAFAALYSSGDDNETRE